MPARVANVRWKCRQCGKSRWLKPAAARKRVYCSRACLALGLRVPNPVRTASRVEQTYGQRICEQCGSEFLARSGNTQRFCTRECASHSLSIRKSGTRLDGKSCETCGKAFRPRTAGGRFCSRPCLYEGMRGDKAIWWRGGRHLTGEGYVRVYSHAGRGGYVQEHRLVMAETLGRPLEDHETVHHINGNKADNRPENLQLRSGRHGNGVVHRCADCGSTNIITEAIAVP